MAGVYYCPVCNDEVSLRKGAKRQYFVHKTIVTNCTPEIVLQFSFKQLLAAKIESSICSHTPLNFGWHCVYCNENHSGNLLKRTESIKVDPIINEIKADIAMFDKYKNVICAIEITVNKKQDNERIQLYSDKGIILIQIDLTSDEDISKLDSKIASPKFVSFCVNPKCDKCGDYKLKSKMTIVEAPCWKCESTMKVAMVEREGIRGPDSFTDEEIACATANGAIIQMHYSKTASEKYLANTCENCMTFVGNFHLFIDYFSLIYEVGRSFKTFEPGYYCECHLSQ